jgi:hypothetical protein
MWFSKIRASGVNLKRNLIQTSLARSKRGFYVLFCVLNVPCQECLKELMGLYFQVTLYKYLKVKYKCISEKEINISY